MSADQSAEIDALDELLPAVDFTDEGRARRDAVVSSIAFAIEEHANAHRNSNSPYGRSCPSECLASAVLLVMRHDAQKRRVAPPGCLVDPACGDGGHSARCGMSTRPGQAAS